jgi:hypothetical protein
MSPCNLLRTSHAPLRPSATFIVPTKVESDCIVDVYSWIVRPLVTTPQVTTHYRRSARKQKKCGAVSIAGNAISLMGSSVVMGLLVLRVVMQDDVRERLIVLVHHDRAKTREDGAHDICWAPLYKYINAFFPILHVLYLPVVARFFLWFKASYGHESNTIGQIFKNRTT